MYHQDAIKRRHPLIVLSQSEYAQILAKRVSETKAKESEARKRRVSSMRK